MILASLLTTHNWWISRIMPTTLQFPFRMCGLGMCRIFSSATFASPSFAWPSICSAWLPTGREWANWKRILLQWERRNAKLSKKSQFTRWSHSLAICLFRWWWRVFKKIFSINNFKNKGKCFLKKEKLSPLSIKHASQ